MGCYDKNGGVRCGRPVGGSPLDLDPPQASSSKIEKSAPSSRKETDATTCLAETFPLPPLGVQDEKMSAPRAMQAPTQESNDLFETMEE